MNLYHCMIELKDDAKALVFAAAVDNWMEHLRAAGVISDWRLMRRKMGLASDTYLDFLLEIEVENMAQFDRAFSYLGSGDEDAARKYEHMHQLIGARKIALYRPYPDPERVERMAII